VEEVAMASGDDGILTEEQLLRAIEAEEWYCSEGESNDEEEGGEDDEGPETSSQQEVNLKYLCYFVTSNSSSGAVFGYCV